MVDVAGNWYPTRLWFWNPKGECGIVPHHLPLKIYGVTRNEPCFRKWPPIEAFDVDATVLTGRLAEWSIAAVLKIVEGNTSVGSNPTSSAHIF